jgi:hypothetical protein
MDKLFKDWLKKQPKSVLQDRGKFETAKVEHFGLRVFYPGTHKGYVFLAETGVYVGLSEKALLRELYVSGLGFKMKPRTLKHAAKSNEEITPEEKSRLTALVLSHAHRNNQIDWYGNLAGYPQGFQVINNRKILVLESPEFIEPHKGSCEFTLDFIKSLFGEQTPIFLAWLKRAVKILRKGPPFDPIQVLIVGGGVEHGKTLLVDELITPCLNGSQADATPHFQHATPFNKDLSESACWKIDDPITLKFSEQRQRGEFLKKVAADPFLRIEIKGVNAVNIPTYRALVILLNTENENFRVLPPLTPDLTDKIIALKSSPAELPRGPGHRGIIRRKLREERAAVLQHLEDYKVPANVRSDGRFEIQPFQHPVILEGIQNVSNDSVILEVIAHFMAGLKMEDWTDRAFEMWVQLNRDDTYRHLLLNVCPTYWFFCRALINLTSSRPDRVVKLPDKRDGQPYRIISPELAAKLEEKIESGETPEVANPPKFSKAKAKS